MNIVLKNVVFNIKTTQLAAVSTGWNINSSKKPASPAAPIPLRALRVEEEDAGGGVDNDKEVFKVTKGRCEVEGEEVDSDADEEDQEDSGVIILLSLFISFMI